MIATRKLLLGCHWSPCSWRCTSQVGVELELGPRLTSEPYRDGCTRKEPIDPERVRRYYDSTRQARCRPGHGRRNDMRVPSRQTKAGGCTMRSAALCTFPRAECLGIMRPAIKRPHERCRLASGRGPASTATAPARQTPHGSGDHLRRRQDHRLGQRTTCAFVDVWSYDAKTRECCWTKDLRG